MTDTITISLSPQDALVAVMIATSASDANIRTAELLQIENAVNTLPIFGAYDADRIQTVAQMVFDLFEQDDGLDALFGLLRQSLPERLYETAYALACDVAASDGRTLQPELQLLQEVRDELNLDRLAVAAIERAARVRYITE